MLAVIDTNCLLASVPPQSAHYWSYHAFEQERFNWLISNEILSEYEEKLIDRYLYFQADLFKFVFIGSIMPELFRFFGIKFFFFSREHLPVHIHIKNADGHAKYVLDPIIELVENNGMKHKDLRLAERIIEENKELIKLRWEEYHGTSD